MKYVIVLVLTVISVARSSPLGAQNSIPRYEKQDVASVLQKEKQKDGTFAYSLDTKLIAGILEVLEPHARVYPTQFASKRDEKQAREDVSKLSKILVAMTKDDEQARSLLLHQSAKLHSMAHNMGLKGAVGHADRCYQLLVKRHPDNMQIKFEYGRYLFFSRRHKASIQYLKAAHENGHETAAFQLGLAHAVTGNKEGALYYLKNYQRRFPDDKNAPRIIRAVENDAIETVNDSIKGRDDNDR